VRNYPGGMCARVRRDVRTRRFAIVVDDRGQKGDRRRRRRRRRRRVALGSTTT